MQSMQDIFLKNIFQNCVHEPRYLKWSTVFNVWPLPQELHGWKLAEIKSLAELHIRYKVGSKLEPTDKHEKRKDICRHTGRLIWKQQRTIILERVLNWRNIQIITTNLFRITIVTFETLWKRIHQIKSWFNSMISKQVYCWRKEKSNTKFWNSWSTICKLLLLAAKLSASSS